MSPDMDNEEKNIQVISIFRLKNGEDGENEE